jgi:hypothetical protein
LVPNLRPRFGSLKRNEEKKRRFRLDPLDLPYFGPPLDLVNLPTYWTWQVHGGGSGELGAHGDGIAELHVPTITSLLFFFWFPSLFSLSFLLLPQAAATRCKLLFLFCYLLLHPIVASTKETNMARSSSFHLFLLLWCSRNYNANNMMTRGNGCPCFSLRLGINS